MVLVTLGLEERGDVTRGDTLRTEVRGAAALPPDREEPPLSVSSALRLDESVDPPRTGVRAAPVRVSGVMPRRLRSGASLLRAVTGERGVRSMSTRGDPLPLLPERGLRSMSTRGELPPSSGLRALRTDESVPRPVRSIPDTERAVSPSRRLMTRPLSERPGAP